MKPAFFYLLIFGAVLSPIYAFAHLVTTGMGPVYDGAGHLLLTPEDFIPVIALSVYAGLRNSKAGRFALLLLPLSWLTGGLIGLLFDVQPAFPLPALSFLLLGLLIAADVNMSPLLVGLLCLLIGSVHGLLNGNVLKDGPAALGIVGITCSIFVVTAILSAVILSLRPNWARIVIRVMGSWIAASGLLMIGWYFRGQIS